MRVKDQIVSPQEPLLLFKGQLSTAKISHAEALVENIRCHKMACISVTKCDICKQYLVLNANSNIIY